jgi:uncharacterized protein YgfB (UPF0149 family)
MNEWMNEWIKSCGLTAHTAKISALEVDEPENIIQDNKEVGRRAGLDVCEENLTESLECYDDLTGNWEQWLLKKIIKVITTLFNENCNHFDTF